MAIILYVFQDVYKNSQTERMYLKRKQKIIQPLLTKEQTNTLSQFGSYSYSAVPDIGMMVRVFANGPGDLGSIPGRVIQKTQKMVLDTSLLNSQHHKIRIKGKVEQSRERSFTPPYALS